MRHFLLSSFFAIAVMLNAFPSQSVAAIPSLEIVEPGNGYAVRPGDQITVTADQLAGLATFYFDSGIFLISRGPFSISNPISIDPWVFHVTANANANPGDYAIIAVGSHNGKPTFSPPLHIIIEADNVKSLKAEPVAIDLPFPGAVTRIYVTGITVENATVTIPGSQVTFQVDNQSVATVSNTGRVSAMGSGQTIITINYQNLTLQVPVKVPQNQSGDLNDDGKIGIDDMNILKATLNRLANGSNDARDLNHDGKIDALDIQILSTLCKDSNCTTTPSAPTPKPTVTLTASPATVAYNGSSTLSWSSTDAFSCTASGGWSGAKPVTGNQTISVLTENQTYILSCAGIGGDGSASNSVIVNAQIANQPPVANAGVDQTLTINKLITLNGDASSDPDKGPSALTYAWTQISGSAVTLDGPTTANPTFTPTQAGDYVFGLVVFDGQANSPQSTATIHVTASLQTSTECLFNWAEKNYPDLFAPAGSSLNSWSVYNYRYYSTTNAYLGISSVDNHIYYMGPDGKLQDEGSQLYWLPKAGCQNLAPPPTECLFNWAEINYPSLFAPAGSPTLTSIPYTYRYYSTTNAYLRVSSIDNHVYYQNGDGKLQDEGAASYWLSLTSCQ